MMLHFLTRTLSCSTLAVALCLASASCGDGRVQDPVTQTSDKQATDVDTKAEAEFVPAPTPHGGGTVDPTPVPGPAPIDDDVTGESDAERQARQEREAAQAALDAAIAPIVCYAPNRTIACGRMPLSAEAAALNHCFTEAPQRECFLACRHPSHGGDPVSLAILPVRCAGVSAAVADDLRHTILDIIGHLMGRFFGHRG